MAEWVKNKERNAEIRRLRGEGKSIREIANLLQCSKATVSYHCRGTEKLPQKHSPNSAVKTNWQQKIDAICEQAKNEWPKIQNDPALMGFLGLYWGEGYKAKNGGTKTGQVGITNNDPKLVLAIYRQLRWLSNKQFKATVIYYKSHNRKQCERFWSELLPEVEIKMKKNTDGRSKTKWSDNCPYGRCQLKFSDWELFWKLTTWIECWKHGIVA